MCIYIKELLSIPLFRILLVLYCLGNCSIVTLGSIINIISTNFEFDSYIGSIIALVVITLGLTSSIIYSIFFIHLHNQSMILMSFSMACIVSLLGALVSAIYQ